MDNILHEAERILTAPRNSERVTWKRAGDITVADVGKRFFLQDDKVLILGVKQGNTARIRVEFEMQNETVTIVFCKDEKIGLLV